jgi:hypothetical protein
VTPNDEQIGLLIRRFAARVPTPVDGGGHLDADEMSAFAEGALPAAARAHYVSHLAECDQCRRHVSDLAIASGAVVRLSQDIPQTQETKAWWAALGGLFSLPILRYAALAAVLLVVAGVAFIALRRRSEPTLVALNEQRQQTPVSAVKPAADAGTVGDSGESTKAVRTPSVSQVPGNVPAGATSPTAVDELTKVDSAKVPATIAAPVEPKEVAAAEPAPMKKAEVATRTQTQTQPYYAPAPPGESQSVGRSAQSQTQSGAGQSLGGFKMSQQADKSQAEDRERDRAKDARLDDAARQRDNDAVLAQRRGVDEKQKGGPSRNMDNANVAMNNRNSNEVRRSESPRKSDSAPASEEAPQTRSVGGRKFARQGNRWVDQKFKSSMSLTQVSRGSDEFAALDSGLRSIAQQLGGEVIVVWKGKAYLFR